ncbi:MAG: transposase [Nitrospirae bacterium]|nr:transposase [Nitrospirota bacterium]
MARPLRIEFPGAYYHVTSRGNERKDIFHDDHDRKQFIFYLKSANLRYKAVIHIYCLMSNHYHFLMETPKGNLSQIMRHINGAYTTYFNIRHRRAGHLFQGRYKAILVDADAYAGELSRYIHLNPVRAGMVDIPEKYGWSSYAYYIDKKKKPDWLTLDFILRYFDGKGKSPQKRYKVFVSEKINCNYESPLQKTTASTILGSDNFINTVREKYIKGINDNNIDRNLPAIRELKTTSDINELCEAIDSLIDADPALSRNVSLYLCHKYSGRALKEIGNYFGIKESAVSQSSIRFSHKLDKDKKLKKRVDYILKKLDL